MADHQLGGSPKIAIDFTLVGVIFKHKLYECMIAEQPDRLILSPKLFSNQLMLFIRYVPIRIFWLAASDTTMYFSYLRVKNNWIN